MWFYVYLHVHIQDHQTGISGISAHSQLQAANHPSSPHPISPVATQRLSRRNCPDTIFAASRVLGPTRQGMLGLEDGAGCGRLSR